MSVLTSKADLRERITPLPVAERGDSLLRLAVWVALYAIAAVTALQPIAEYDTWWHLRTGQWIVEHGAIPTVDPFSSFGLGKPWAAYSWLFGLLLYGLYQAFGLAGIVLCRVALALAVVGALQRLVARRASHFAVTAGLVAAAVVALTPLLVSERPGLFTILFAALTLDAVLALRAGRAGWTVWLLPLCYALWANVHIQFVHGLLVLGLACAAPALDRLLGRGQRGANADSWGSRGWWQLVALCAACGAATLLNPYHVYLYGVVLEYSRQKETYKLFDELKAMDFREVSDWVVIGLTGAAAWALGRKAKLSAFDVLLLGTAVYFSYHAKHDLWFVVLAACGIIPAGNDAPSGSAPARAPLRVAVKQGLLGAAALASIVALVAWQRDLSERRLQAEVAAAFPTETATFLAERGCSGPLYNPIDWGGYLIWRLPNLPVAIDGQTNIHGDRRIKRFADTWQGLPGWDADPDLAAARVVVLQQRAPLAALLRRDQRFALAHEDAMAVVFIPQGPR